MLLLILSPPSASADSVATTGGFTLELGPVNGVNVVGTQHQVTARLGASGGVIAAAHLHFAVSGSNTMSGNATTNASGEATFSYAGANSGTDTITACFDANDDQLCEGDELAVNVTKRWITAGAGQAGVTLGLTPITAVNPVGTAHTVTATVNGGVQANQKIHFAVTGANATTGDATTDASGQASFTYTGAAAGTDTIVACIDGNGNKACDDDELAVSVVKRFVGAAGTQGGGGAGGGGGGQVTAGSGAAAQTAVAAQAQTQSSAQSKTKTTKAKKKKAKKRAHRKRKRGKRKSHARRPLKVGGGFTG